MIIKKITITITYVWLNLIPIIWGKRGTIEFRCHTPTVQPIKVINWLFITVAILKYAKKHTDELTSVIYESLPKLSISDIVTEVYPKSISRILCKYIEDRTSYYARKHDEIGEQEILSEGMDNDVLYLNPFI